ncbi:POU domain, class 5, transcription factor 1.1-like [Anomaloglossus baeobatrachus]|uniref:POU domain, class 5, transcription factor 1.1-like n=1 Tax=Anomaloglossus baeobatrachus TaxID=238106 RepID=UPI003F4FE4D4
METLGHLNLPEPLQQVRAHLRYRLEKTNFKAEGDKPEKPSPAEYFHLLYNFTGKPNFEPIHHLNHRVNNPSVYLTTAIQGPDTEDASTTLTAESSPYSSSSAPSPAKQEDEVVDLTSPYAEVQEEDIFSEWEENPEPTTKEEMAKFVKVVREKRAQTGFTQADVGILLGSLSLNGRVLSQATICRFESNQLSFRNMCQLKPLMARWMEKVDQQENLDELLRKCQAVARTQKKKPRTVIENFVKERLETYFLKNQKPGPPEIAQIAHDLPLDKEVVRVWFCNRRQKEKRDMTARDNRALRVMPHMVNVHMWHLFSHQERTSQNCPPAPQPLGSTAPSHPPGFKHRNDKLPQHMPHGHHK